MKTTTSKETLAAYYDRRGVLAEIADAPVPFCLKKALRRQVLSGKPGSRLRNVSITLDTVQIQALRKIATLRSIPYQTLIRELLAAGNRRDLRMVG
jgi:hypothetical protein